MNESVKAAWVAALRSGRYKQGQGKLRNTDDFSLARHCCLGVLCELALEAGVVNARWDEDNPIVTVFADSVNFLPQKVVEWAGLTAKGTDPRVTLAQGGEATLSRLNDSGFDFETIANVIEEQL